MAAAVQQSPRRVATSGEPSPGCRKGNGARLPKVECSAPPFFASKKINIHIRAVEKSGWAE
eukprot:gene562-27607_t